MEVILQWLDDLDDLVSALLQIAERARWPSLKIAFVAALSLVVARIVALPDVWGPLLSSVSLGGLILWAAGTWLVARQAATVIASGGQTRTRA